MLRFLLTFRFDLLSLYQTELHDLTPSEHGFSAKCMELKLRCIETWHLDDWSGVINSVKQIKPDRFAKTNH